jgi:aprataxin
MTTLTILHKYASKADPSSLPSSVLFTHTASSLTIYDLYPKSNSFHYLLLPRIVSPLTAPNTASLKALLRWDKTRARECLEGLAKDAECVKNTIKQEMVKQFGFEWPIFVGFHAVRNVSCFSRLRLCIFNSLMTD